MKVATLQSREAAWDSIQPLSVDSSFFWIQHNGEKIHPTEMKTTHLFNALKVVWNNSVSEEYQIDTARPWLPVWSKTYCRKAIANLFSELMNRIDRTELMNESLKQIAEYLSCAKAVVSFSSGRNYKIFDELTGTNLSSARKWQLRNPEKFRAQWLAQRALQKGLIKQEPCEVCNSKNSQMHHDDYSKPYSVRWFCQKHHNNHHKEKRKRKV